MGAPATPSGEDAPPPPTGVGPTPSVDGVEGLEGPVFEAVGSFPVAFETGVGSFVDPSVFGAPSLTPVPSSATGSAAPQEKTVKLRPKQKQRIQMGMYQASSWVQPRLKALRAFTGEAHSGANRTRRRHAATS